MLSFIQFIRQTPWITNTKNCEVLEEIATDKDFPETVKKWVILDYLDSKKMPKRKIDIVDGFFYEYIKYINHACDPEK